MQHLRRVIPKIDFTTDNIYKFCLEIEIELCNYTVYIAERCRMYYYILNTVGILLIDST